MQRPHLPLRSRRLALLAPLILGALVTGARAADTAPVQTAAASAPGGLPPGGIEPQVIDRVTEDEHVRIEELRVRGESKRITVQPKIPGMPAYEIVPAQGGRAPSQDPKAGQRVWFNLTF